MTPASPLLAPPHFIYRSTIPVVLLQSMVNHILLHVHVYHQGELRSKPILFQKLQSYIKSL